METDLFTTEALKKQNPEKYFQEVLDVSEFQGLQTLVKDSEGKISWEKLVEENVVKIVYNKYDSSAGKVEGIYWSDDLDLSGTKIKSLWKLKKVLGNLSCNGLETLEDLGELEEVIRLDLSKTNVKSLGKLKKVRGNLVCTGLESLKDLGKLQKVGGDFFLRKSSIEIQLQAIKKANKGEIVVGESLLFGGKMEKIEILLGQEEIPGDLDIRSSSVKNLGKVKKIKGSLLCHNQKDLESLGELEEVGGDFDARGMLLKSLGKLKKVGNFLDCRESGNLEDLGDLEEVGNSLLLGRNKIKSLGKLRKIGGNLENSRDLEDIGNLEEVKGNLYLSATNLKTLGKLKRVGGNLNCLDLIRLEDLGDLEKVGGNLDLGKTKIKTLGNLEEVGGSLDCNKLKTLKTLGKLKKVGGKCYFTLTSITDLGELEEIGEHSNLEGLNIRSLGKLRKTKGLYLDDIESLEDIGNLELVEGTLDIKGTSAKFQIQVIEKMKSGKLKVTGPISFGGNIKGIERLLENLLEQKEIPGTLNLINMPIDVQLLAIEKIQRWKLKNKNFIFFGGNIEGIERLLEQEEIPGNLSLRDNSIEGLGKIIKSLGKIKKVSGYLDCYGLSLLENIGNLEDVEGYLNMNEIPLYSQVYVQKRINEGTLTVSDFAVEARLKQICENLYKDGKLDFKEFKLRFGEDISIIEDGNYGKDIAKTILLLEYEVLKKEMEGKVEEIIEENKEKILSENQKKELRYIINELALEIELQKVKIENFGIRIEDL